MGLRWLRWALRRSAPPHAGHPGKRKKSADEKVVELPAVG
jgi:hypothetical protein